ARRGPRRRGATSCSGSGADFSVSGPRSGFCADSSWASAPAAAGAFSALPRSEVPCAGVSCGAGAVCALALSCAGSAAPPFCPPAGRELERRRRRRPVVLSTAASILASASALASASPPAGVPACFSPWSGLSDFAALSVLSALSDVARALSPPLSLPLAGASGFFPPSSDCAAFGADSASAASSLCSAIALNIGCSAGFFSVLGTSRLAACCSPPLLPPPPPLPLPPLPRRERRDSPLLREDPDPEPELTIGSACT